MVTQMTMDRLGGRQLKRRVRELLTQGERGLAEILDFPLRRAVNPLFGFLYDRDALIRWRAVSAMGTVTAALADCQPESARVVMRRLLWNLNDESGGIGWGSPEAMGDILARHEILAGEYADLLVSYAREDGNFIEYEALQRWVVWALGRLAQVRPHLLTEVPALLVPYMSSSDAVIRGLSAWTAGLLKAGMLKERIQVLTIDRAKVIHYIDGCLIDRTVAELADEALSRILGRAETAQQTRAG